ncbi:MAG: ArsB/NhaD family transporter [Eubacteriales bacterium]|nr:ArsB/NhaD family transporter [Eubacteriales bacterium]
MLITAVIGTVSCFAMVIGVFFKPKLFFGKIGVDTYWLFPLMGALTLIAAGKCKISSLVSSLTADTAINPVKILILFISVTVLSIYLDETGFFGFLAEKTLRFAKASQIKMFVYLYIIISLLTVFTSNDIIILTFTPFICYFTKNAGINPVPYLTAEFVAANTWSMALIIGNPTNIYLASFCEISFFSYLKTMLLPALFAGAASFTMLLILFGKKLSQPVKPVYRDAHIKDKALLSVGLIHLCACTLLLAVSSYTGWNMWVITFVSAVSLFVFTLIFNIIRKEKPHILVGCIKRAPWQLIPFVLSMFVIVLTFYENGVSRLLSDLLGTKYIVLKYGFSSFLASNVINNIPMSVLFCSFIGALPETARVSAAYAAVIGSNIGAVLTPVGALAGIMWSSVLKNQEVKFGRLDFIKYGALISLPALLAALVGLVIAFGGWL